MANVTLKASLRRVIAILGLAKDKLDAKADRGLTNVLTAASNADKIVAVGDNGAGVKFVDLPGATTGANVDLSNLSDAGGKKIFDVATSSEVRLTRRTLTLTDSNELRWIDDNAFFVASIQPQTGSERLNVQPYRIFDSNLVDGTVITLSDLKKFIAALRANGINGKMPWEN